MLLTVPFTSRPSFAIASTENGAQNVTVSAFSSSISDTCKMAETVAYIIV